MKARLIFLFICMCLFQLSFGQNADQTFRKHTFAIFSDSRSFYDSGVYNVFKPSDSRSFSLGFSYILPMNNGFKWHSELALTNYSGFKNGNLSSSQFGGWFLGTYVSYSIFKKSLKLRNDRFPIDPYVRFGYRYAYRNVPEVNGYSATSLALGFNAQLTKVFNVFYHFDGQVGLGEKALSSIGHQMGIQFRFDLKEHKQLLKNYNELGANYDSLDINYDRFTLKHNRDSAITDSINRSLNVELMDLKLASDSLITVILRLQANNWNQEILLKLKEEQINLMSDSLKALRLNDWSEWRWQTEEVDEKNNGFFAVLYATYDLEALLNDSNKASFPESFYVQVNKFEGYRLVYFLGAQNNNATKNLFEKLLQLYPSAEIKEFNKD